MDMAKQLAIPFCGNAEERGRILEELQRLLAIPFCGNETLYAWAVRGPAPACNSLLWECKERGLKG